MPEIHQHSGKSSERLLDKGAILKTLVILPGQVILDAGCGDGYMAKEFSKLTGNDGRVYAIDMYEPSIQSLQNGTVGSNLTAIKGDVTQPIDLEDSSVDLVYLSTVFHGFTDSQRHGFLKEVKRILRPDGILAVVEINKGDTPFGPPMEMRVSPEDLSSIVGLKVQNLIKISAYFYMQTFVNKDKGTL